MSRRIFIVCISAAFLAAIALSATAGSPAEDLLEQLVQKYMEQKFGAAAKYIMAAEPRVEKTKLNLRKGKLEAKVKGSFKLAGKRYNASYGTTWKDKNNCAYVTDIDFSTELNPTVSDVGKKAMRALYENKCESDQKLTNAIKAAWLIKGLLP